MSNSLGVVLPVYNACHSLSGGMGDVLELLAEGGRRFELLVIDDGSAEDTAEITQELSARYPQIRVIRHPVRLGLSEAIQTGLDESRAEYVLVSNDAYELDLDDLRTLWRLREMEREMLKRGESAALSINPAARSDRSGMHLPLNSLVNHLGFQLIRRATFDELRLGEAIDAIARIDSAARAAMPSPARPNFVNRVMRLARGDQ